MTYKEKNFEKFVKTQHGFCLLFLSPRGQSVGFFAERQKRNKQKTNTLAPWTQLQKFRFHLKIAKIGYFWDQIGGSDLPKYS